jgi:phage/plasmid-like protein (TIGR03299 family)
MAANLATTRNGTAMIASLRQMPWHGQGIVFQEPVNGREMLKLAGLDFQVLACPIFGKVRKEGAEKAVGWDAATDTPVMGRELSVPTDEEVEGIRGIYRSDTGAILGLASEKYEIFQNEEMVEVMDAIAKDGGITYEVAGGLGKGERVWVLANIPDLCYDVKGDAMKQYLTIFTSHDGSSALNIFPTTVRVVCANTWRAATVERQRMEATHGKQTVKAGYSIKHTRNMKAMVQQAVDAFAAAVEANKFSREFYRSLAEVPATSAMKDEFFTFIVNGGEGKDEKETLNEMSKRTAARRDAKRAELEMLLRAATNQTAAAAGTAWGLWNSASEWIDHLAPTRKVGSKSEDAARFESSQFGGGADLKDAAMGKIAELAGV